MVDQNTRLPEFSSQTLETPAYVVNPNVKLPEWVKCTDCKKGPTASDWLKPIHPNAECDPKRKECRHLIHLSHIPNGPVLSQEAGFIARNA